MTEALFQAVAQIEQAKEFVLLLEEEERDKIIDIIDTFQTLKQNWSSLRDGFKKPINSMLQRASEKSIIQKLSNEKYVGTLISKRVLATFKNAFSDTINFESNFWIHFKRHVITPTLKVSLSVLKRKKKTSNWLFLEKCENV